MMQFLLTLFLDQYYLEKIFYLYIIWIYLRQVLAPSRDKPQNVLPK